MLQHDGLRHLDLHAVVADGACLLWDHESHTLRRSSFRDSLHACHVRGGPGYQEDNHGSQLLAPSPEYLVCCCHEHGGPVSHNVPEVGVHLNHVLRHRRCNLADEIGWFQPWQSNVRC